MSRSLPAITRSSVLSLVTLGSRRRDRRWRPCEYCYHKAVSLRPVLGTEVSLCRGHTKEYDDWGDGYFYGAVTRTQHNLLCEIMADPVARHLLRKAQKDQMRSAYAIINAYGDPREWAAYQSTDVYSPEPEPQPNDGTHPHWAIRQNPWSGRWYIQRGVRQGKGTAFDPPLPGHTGFKTKREALEFKRSLPPPNEYLRWLLKQEKEE